MHQTKAGRRVTRMDAPAGGGAVLVFLCAIVVCGQTTTQRGKSQGVYPRLPGAQTKAPASIGTDAPFDVAKFFATVPRDSNAAPLYLDALFEFSTELEVCFPEGTERERRSRTTKDRNKRYNDLVQPAYADPKTALDLAAVDEMIKRYDTGFKKLADAQRRERCVFETGFSAATLLPHAQTSRQVYRVSSLRLQRAVQRGDLAAAIREVETVLRLARDLRPRGVIISQLVADAISQAVLSGMVPVILASPRLRAEHCERLIKVLTVHEAKSIDGYVEGFSAQYMVTRATLDDLVHHQGELAKAIGVKPGESLVRAVLVRDGPNSSPGGAAASPTPSKEWDALVARTPAAQVSRLAKEVDKYFSALLNLDGMPYAKRIERILALKSPAGPDLLSRAMGTFMQTERSEAVARASSRVTASLHAAECLLALRRWQFSHEGSPADLPSMIKGSGLKTVPIDPYDGKPFRLASVDDHPVIYSIGRDGKDDGGLTDSNLDQKPSGDLTYRLPPIEENHILKP